MSSRSGLPSVPSRRIGAAPAAHPHRFAFPRIAPGGLASGRRRRNGRRTGERRSGDGDGGRGENARGRGPARPARERGSALAERAAVSGLELYERILESLHAGAFDDARWAGTSGLVDAFCGAKGNHLVLGDGAAPGPIDILFHPVLLPRRAPPRPRAGVFRGLAGRRRTASAHQAPGGRPAGAGARAVQRGGEEDLGALERVDGAHRGAGRAERASRRAGRLVHRVVVRRSGGRGGLVGRAGGADRVAAAACPPLRAGAPGAGRRQRARGRR